MIKGRFDTLNGVLYIGNGLFHALNDEHLMHRVDHLIYKVYHLTNETNPLSQKR